MSHDPKIRYKTKGLFEYLKEYFLADLLTNKEGFIGIKISLKNEKNYALILSNIKTPSKDIFKVYLREGEYITEELFDFNIEGIFLKGYTQNKSIITMPDIVKKYYGEATYLKKYVIKYFTPNSVKFIGSL